MRARRDPADVRRPWARREAPRRSRRQLEQRFQLTPAVAAIIAPEQPARLRARVHRPVGRAHRKREDTRLGKRAVDPVAPAVPRPAYPVRTQTRIQGVRVERVNRKTLRAASGQEELADPPVTGLVKANDSVPGRGVKTCHRPRALTQGVPRSKPKGRHMLTDKHPRLGDVTPNGRASTRQAGDAGLVPLLRDPDREAEALARVPTGQLSAPCSVRSASTCPFTHVGYVYCKHGTVGWFAAVLRVLLARAA